MSTSRRSSSRSSSKRSKPQSRGSQIMRANNVRVFKLVDPVIQSLLFIFFIYCLDSDTEIEYQFILTLIIFWQILSAVANLILKPVEQLKTARIIFLIMMVAYMVVSHFALTSITEKVVTIKQANNMSIRIYESIFIVVALIISFWYYVICFREIRAMLTSSTNEAS